jgi:hypothetical protein
MNQTFEEWDQTFEKWIERETIREWDNVPYNQRGSLNEMSNMISNQGTVVWIGEKNYKGRTLYQFTLAGEDSMWYQCGEGNANFKKLEVGDHVKFNYEERARNGRVNLVVDLDSLNIEKGGGSVDPATGKEVPLKPKELRGVWGGASNRALEFVGLLLSQEIVSLPKTKPSEAAFNLVELWSARFFQSVMDDDKLLELLPKKEEDEAVEDDDDDLPY